MKTKFVLTVIIGLSIVTLISGCRKDEDVPINNPANGDLLQILKTDSLIAIVADSVFLSVDPISGWTVNLMNFKNFPIVEDAWVTTTDLYIKYRNGGVRGWHLNQMSSKDDYFPGGGNKIQIKSTSGLIGNKNVLLVNNVSADEQFKCWNGIFTSLESEFENKGFDVTTLFGEHADLNFYRHNLKGYGVMYNLGHGSFDGTVHWMQTGQHDNFWITGANFLRDLLKDTQFRQEWNERKITVMDVREYHNKIVQDVGYVWISENLINSNYQTDDFPNSLIYLTNCQLFKGNQNLAVAFHSKGAGVVLGWDETHDISDLPESGVILLENMLSDGSSLQVAYSNLPESKRKQVNDDFTAKLKFNPDPEGGSVYLIKEEPVEFGDDFSDASTLSTNWTLSGSPQPVWVSSAFGRTGLFDDMGDSWYTSVAYSKKQVGNANGFTMETEVYLDIANPQGCWVISGLGLTKEANPSPVPAGQDGDLPEGLSFCMTYEGGACWGTPGQQQYHAYFWISVLAEDGTTDNPGSYDLNADSYINGWHKMKITVGADRYVKFYCDGNLIWSSTKKISPSMMTKRNLVLGYRSSGSAGKTYHDWVKVTYP